MSPGKRRIADFLQFVAPIEWDLLEELVERKFIDLSHGVGCQTMSDKSRDYWLDNLSLRGLVEKHHKPGGNLYTPTKEAIDVVHALQVLTRMNRSL